MPTSREPVRPDVLVLDDFAVRRLGASQADDLHDLVGERQGRSLTTTGNRAPSDWHPLFPDPVVAESLLDRSIGTSRSAVAGPRGGWSGRAGTRPRPDPTLSTTRSAGPAGRPAAPGCRSRRALVPGCAESGTGPAPAAPATRDAQPRPKYRPAEVRLVCDSRTCMRRIQQNDCYLIGWSGRVRRGRSAPGGAPERVDPDVRFVGRVGVAVSECQGHARAECVHPESDCDGYVRVR
ncbi:ATP-binding protein [Streptomyces virginiae]